MEIEAAPVVQDEEHRRHRWVHPDFFLNFMRLRIIVSVTCLPIISLHSRIVHQVPHRLRPMENSA